jgi:pimeloyl-ACP methyl ester carboxylesterase
VEDLKALLDHLGIKRTVLVAQSMGGGTCTGFTVRYPERVSALVLADTIIGMRLPDQLASRMANLRKATEKLSQLERVLSTTFRENEPVRSQLYAQINSFNAVNRLNLGGSFGTGHTPQELADTKVPIMFLVGRDDILIPPEVVTFTHQSIPGSQFLEVPNCGHSVYFEDPKTFNEAIIGFLKAVDVERQPYS